MACIFRKPHLAQHDLLPASHGDRREKEIRIHLTLALITTYFWPSRRAQADELRSQFERRCHPALAGAAMRPSCRITPRSSRTAQCSMALPSLKRTKCIWSCSKERPVGGTPWKGPRWVPLMVTRPATVSPSATRSSIVKCRSGKAARRILTTCRVVSGLDCSCQGEPRDWEVRCDQVVYDGEVTLVEHLLKGTTILCFVFFF